MVRIEFNPCDTLINHMKCYLDLVSFILNTGEERVDRTGVGTKSVFGVQSRYDLRQGFPLVTTKKIQFKSVVNELLWFIRGATNIHDGLHTKIWDEWADADGNLGPIYGHQWRRWARYAPHAAGTPSYVDQLTQLIDGIQTNPSSRRHIVSAWNVADLDQMALPPCHAFFQCYVVNGQLDLQLYQRSADMALGVPFNIASYALLLMMLAQECQLTPRYFIHTMGDAHIYLNHEDGLRQQLNRTPKPLPTVSIQKKPFFTITVDDIVLHDYSHDPFIRFQVAV